MDFEISGFDFEVLRPIAKGFSLLPEQKLGDF